MGYIEYFMVYCYWLIVYREGVNGGFYEVIGDIIVLLVCLCKYFLMFGLLEDVNVLEEEKKSSYYFFFILINLYVKF